MTRRVFIVVTDTARGGTPTKLATLALALRERGWTVVVISVMPGGEVLEELKESGVTTESLEVTSIGSALQSLVRLRKMLKRSQPLIVLSALWHANVLARTATVGLGIPTVNGHESVDWDKARTRTLVDRLTNRLAAHHYAVSDVVKTSVIERDAIAPRDVTVIRTGKNLHIWKREGRRGGLRLQWAVPSDVKVVGWVGRLDPVKRVPLLVEALTLLPDWWLVLVGDGPERVAAERLARELSVESRMVITGMQSAVVGYYEMFDVFCLPSAWEGMPAALIEAMAMELPCVGANAPGISEVIEDGVDGLLLSSVDGRGVAARVLEAATHPDMGVAARRKVAERYTENAMVDGFERLLDRTSKRA